MSRELQLLAKISALSGIAAPPYEGNADIPAGYNPWKNKLFASRTFFQSLSDREAEMVLAHEMGHVASKGLVMASYLVEWMSLLFTVVLGLASLLFLVSSSPWAIASLLLLGGLLAFSLALHLKQEVVADDFAVRICGDALAYKQLLLKVSQQLAVAPSWEMRKRLARLERQQGIGPVSCPK